MLHVEHHAGLAADVRAEVIGSGSQLHVCQVAQPEHFALLRGSDDDVLELLHVVQQAVELDVYLVCSALYASDGHNEVLLVDGIDNLLWRHAVETHQVGLQPDAHTVLLAHDHRASHTGYAAYGGHHVDVKVIGYERLVELSVRALQAHNHQGGVDVLLYGDAVSDDIFWKYA